MKKKNTILIVDDEMEIRLLLQEFLEKNGYNVRVAEDGQQALHWPARSFPIWLSPTCCCPRSMALK